MNISGGLCQKIMAFFNFYFSSALSMHCKKIMRFLDIFGPNLPGTGIEHIIPGQGEFGK